MAIDLDQYSRLKKRIDEKQREKDRSEGALQQTLEQLKKDFNCSSIEKAESLLLKMEKEAKAAEMEYQEELEELLANNKEQLGVL